MIRKCISCKKWRRKVDKYVRHCPQCEKELQSILAETNKRTGYSLLDKLDEMCIKHHGGLPYEPF